MPYKDPLKKAAYMATYKPGRNHDTGERRAYSYNPARLESATQKRNAKPFIAVDGEGITGADGIHRYVMLCASTGHTIVKPQGLSFFDCVRFLLNLGALNPDAIFVGFGFGYDANMIFRDLGLDWISRYLLDTEEAEEKEGFRGYTRFDELGYSLYMDWRPGKSVTLKKQGTKKGIQIFDTFGFFQSSFYKALTDNGIGDPTELEEIERMKAARSSFQSQDLAEIERYSVLECRLLVDLMNHLRSCIVGLADSDLALKLTMTRWDGAGALGAALLTFYKVKAHRYPLENPYPKEVLNAYYGGRFETPILGIVPNGYDYDINSAYPEAMTFLPCLKDASFEPGIWDGSSLALLHVTWELPSDTILCPFPFRDEQGHITYPLNGSGWYWSLEVVEAIKRFGRVSENEESRGFGISILVGFNLRVSGDCTCNGRPFAFVNKLYQYRRKLKAEKDARQLPLKLGYNSCYGKLAQGVGAAPFQDFIWAGLITAYTRAKILWVIYSHNAEPYVLQIATDGIALTKKLPLQVGDDLGEWEYTHDKDVFIAGNGLSQYQCSACHGETAPEKECKKCRGTGYLQKVRGFRKGERIDWKGLREAFLKRGMGASVPVKLNRFIGASLARHLTDKSLFCQWQTQDRVFTVKLINRTVPLEWGKVTVETTTRMPVRKRGRVWLTEPLGSPGSESTAHKPKKLKGSPETMEDVATLVGYELESD